MEMEPDATRATISGFTFQFGSLHANSSESAVIGTEKQHVLKKKKIRPVRYP
jgi:hypothetical protein